MFGDLNWPINASRRFVSISWACCYPRDCMLARSLPSHAGIVSKGLNLSLKLFGPSGSPITLVFWPLAPIPNSKGNLSAGAKNTRGGKMCDFRLKLQYISETAWDRPMVTMESVRHVIRGGSIRVVSNELEWPLTPISRSCHYSKSNISKTVHFSYKVTIEH